MSSPFLSVSQLQRAMEIELKIDALKAELAAVLHGAGTGAEMATLPDKRKGQRSPETRARMAAAQKARWAKVNGTLGDGEVTGARPAKTKRVKRTMSAEGRARIAAAQRKRWAAVKAGN